MKATTYLGGKIGLILSACTSVAFAFLLMSALGHPSDAQDESQSLDILNDSVSSTLDKSKTDFEAKVYVLNASTLSDDKVDNALKFTVEARNSDEKVVEPSVTIEQRSPDHLDPYSVMPLDLKIEIPESQEAFSGYLVVSSKKRGSAVDPGTTPLELKKPITRGGDIMYLSWFPPFYSYSWMLFCALAVASLVVLVSYWSLQKPDKPGLTSRMGTTLELDASSWASVLTLVAALVGAVAGANVFPEETAIFTKQEVAGMSLFFGATLIFAPVVYNLVRKPKVMKPPAPTDTETSIVGTFEGSQYSPPDGDDVLGFKGTVDLKQREADDGTQTTTEPVGLVGTYLVAAALILTAVLGQLLLAWLYLAQIEDALPWWARSLLAIAVLITMIFVILYAATKIRADCKQRSKEKADENLPAVRDETWIRPQSTLKMP